METRVSSGWANADFSGAERAPMSPSGPKMGSLGRAASHSDLVVAPGRTQRPCSSTMKRNPYRTARAEPLWTMHLTYDLSPWYPSGSAMRNTELEVAFLAKENFERQRFSCDTSQAKPKIEVKAEMKGHEVMKRQPFGTSGSPHLELQRLHGGCIQ